MLDKLKRFAANFATEAHFWSIRLVDESTQDHEVRNDVVQPFRTSRDYGAMVTAHSDGGAGYAATSDVSVTGLQAALDLAAARARASAGCSLIDFAKVPVMPGRGEYTSPGMTTELPSRAGWLELLAHECAGAAISERIVERAASVQITHSQHAYLSSDGAQIEQRFRFILPNMRVTGHTEGDTQVRSLAGYGALQQGGLEILARLEFSGSGRRLAEDVLRLLAAPNCPTGVRDLLLMPDQMMLQIHESIGHPLELDRILGDERNFAGWSFVIPEMFGSYRYGSDLLNITFDPAAEGEAASYAFDDDGTRAEKQHLIRHGMLERPLGGALSQARAGMSGVANSRASSWNRAPIDRMANLNLEPGTSSMADLIGGIEHGILMRSNISWSIDDRRNKFQFGCEFGQLIEHGQLTEIVKNPNYRGISASFWRSLAAVGDASTCGTYGTPFCGKGEPMQVVRVGHASPACVFKDIEVFGGGI
jgi:predicted Zn-dependent protease